jgi:RNA polymerase sigma-70 factor (ECF subfamily)
MRTEPQDWPERSRELGQLLARAGLGDRAAFAQLYQRTSAHLFGVVLRIQRDRGTAEDLLQEVYVSVWKAAARSAIRSSTRPASLRPTCLRSAIS